MLPNNVSSRCLWAVGAGIVISIFLLFNYRGATGRYWRSKSLSSYTDDGFSQDVSNQTLGFQKIFVVNLPSRTDHKDSMTLAAHFTDLHVEYVDGVTHVEEKTLPPHASEFSLPAGAIGAWRAHMNIASMIVEQNITSALILEDDSDWDLRIKSQMPDFAKASRFLLQPQSGTKNKSWDITNPRSSEQDQPQDYVITSGPTVKPTTSPYGDIDRWDILWLGHCGTRFPRPTDPNVPLGRFIHSNDETVAEPQHIELQFGNDELRTQYPAHTRAVHRVAGNVCTLAYAVSLPGARRMLHEFSMNKITAPMDLMLRDMCEGTDGRKMRTCLTVQPQLFQHHRPKGSRRGQSDIVESSSDEYNPIPFTKNIRWSTRVNLPKLLDGETDYIDSFPDGAEAVDLGF